MQMESSESVVLSALGLKQEHLFLDNHDNPQMMEAEHEHDCDIDNEDEHVNCEDIDVDVDVDSHIQSEVSPRSALTASQRRRQPVKPKGSGPGRPLTADRKRPYPCSQCSSRFGSKMELEEHQNSHTGQKPFQCDVCMARFNRRSTLWNHKRIHSDTKPFTCGVCHMTFKWKNSLKCHREMHLRKHEQTDDPISVQELADCFLPPITYASAKRQTEEIMQNRSPAVQQPQNEPVDQQNVMSLNNQQTINQLHQNSEQLRFDLSISNMLQLGQQALGDSPLMSLLDSPCGTAQASVIEHTTDALAQANGHTEGTAPSAHTPKRGPAARSRRGQGQTGGGRSRRKAKASPMTPEQIALRNTIDAVAALDYSTGHNVSGNGTSMALERDMTVYEEVKPTNLTQIMQQAVQVSGITALTDYNSYQQQAFDGFMKQTASCHSTPPADPVPSDNNQSQQQFYANMMSNAETAQLLNQSHQLIANNAQFGTSYMGSGPGPCVPTSLCDSNLTMSGQQHYSPNVDLFGTPMQPSASLLNQYYQTPPPQPPLPQNYQVPSNSTVYTTVGVPSNMSAMPMQPYASAAGHMMEGYLVKVVPYNEW